LEVGFEKDRNPMKLEAKTCEKKKPTEKDEEEVSQIM
jgi:hypothetical protein